MSPPALLSRDTAAARAAAVFVVGLLVAALLALVHLLQGQAGLEPAEVLRALVAPDGGLESAIVRYARLPRVAVALLCGAALGMAGALMQTVTRNPLASPATLGVNAGAYLALVLAAVISPALLAGVGWWIASAGGLAAAALAYSLGGAGRGGPARLALAGMTVSLALAAVTGALQLLFENETQGLFLWGAGTLAQSDWSGARFIWPRLGAAALLALALAQQLDVLLLEEDLARSLGSRVGLMRLLAGGAAVLLATTAVSVVGPIAFVGLMAPHLVRLVGVRGHALLLPGAALWGGALLVGADVLARAVPTSSTPLPAGAATAFLGAPLIMWLARRAGPGARASDANGAPQRRRLRYATLLLVSAGLLVAAFVAGLALGALQLPPGAVLGALAGRGEELATRVVLDQRLPRLLVAALSGAALATSGLLLQGVVRNPLAAPEIIGVTSGAGAAALAALLLFPALPIGFVPVAAFVGGVLVFGAVVAVAWKGGLDPVRLALVGLAMSALASAVIQALVVTAGLRVAQALTWLAGSTYARGWDDVARLAPWVAVLLPLAWILAYQLDLMALGEELPLALGLRLERSRLLLLGVTVALAGAVVATVGTLSFVGLIAPHMARALTRGQHRRLLGPTVLLGALLVVLADTVGRTLFAPREIPSGLVTAAIGAPYFLYMLFRGYGR